MACLQVNSKGSQAAWQYKDGDFIDNREEESEDEVKDKKLRSKSYIPLLDLCSKGSKAMQKSKAYVLENPGKYACR